MRVALLLASAAIVASPLAYAQTASNVQHDLRGSTSEIEVDVGSTYDVGATAIAGGNAYAITGDGDDVTLDGMQHADGAVSADADATIGSAGGNVVVTSASVANGATVAGRDGDVDVRGTQWSHANSSSTTSVETGYVGASASSAAASANVAALAAENGEVRALLTQESTGALDAVTDASHWGSDGQVVADAIASANSVAAAGTTTTMLTATTQYSFGDHVNAEVQLFAGHAEDVVGNATANANSIAVDNQFGYANTRAEQNSGANVGAASFVTLGDDFNGFASAGAYGVGNTVTASNSASNMDLDVTQYNEGDVSADAGLIANGGEQALASAAAYGNSVTGALCGNCGDGYAPTLNADNDQVNAGAVRARATINAPNAGMAAGSVTAIGNAASYQVSGPS